jgi:glycosyltransferase involved in cell wall biosynthesis
VKVALVHDYLTEMGGAERVVLALARMFPDAPIYTSVYDPSACPEFAGHDVRTTFMQRLTRRKAVTKALFPLFPKAFARLDLTGYDTVVSSSSGFAHHVRPAPGALHLCYCHNPPRFLWQPEDYFRGKNATRAVLASPLAGLRRLDRTAAGRVGIYVANSRTVAGRIEATYGRSAEVVHPPVDTAGFEVTDERSGRFLVVSRLLPYKRIDLAVEAANGSGLPLDVIGDGPERRRLERLAGPTVRFLGRRPDDVVRGAMARCAAVVLPGAEDFGLTPVEAQASGRPVVAFAAGGALETVRDGETGVLFHKPDARSLAAAMQESVERAFSVDALRDSAARFDTEVFEAKILDVLGVSGRAARTQPAASPSSARP